MNFKSTETHESTTCEGVRFTVRALNVIQRAERDAQVSEHQWAFAELLGKYQRVRAEEPLAKEAEEVAVELSKLGEPHGDLAARVVTLINQYQAIKTEIPEARRADYESGLLMDLHLKPSVIRAGLVSVEGLMDGEEEITDAEGVIQHAPSKLIEEIWIECQRAAGLGETDSKNSQSPGTSAGQADGKTSSSTASNVSE